MAFISCHLVFHLAHPPAREEVEAVCPDVIALLPEASIRPTFTVQQQGREFHIHCEWLTPVADDPPGCDWAVRQWAMLRAHASRLSEDYFDGAPTSTYWSTHTTPPVEQVA